MVFIKRKYKTLNLIEISKSALINNYNYFQQLQPGSKICPVLKSNAYGHGLKLIGKFVDQKLNPEFVCVDSLYEAYELKKIGFKGKSLIIGYTFPENFKYKRLKNISLPVFDRQTIALLNKYQPEITVHLKIDTGMNRLGFKENQFEEIVRELKKYPKIKVEGIYSHLASADSGNTKDSLNQITKFKKAISFFESFGFHFKWKHIFATAGAVKFSDPQFNMIRLGLGFYGLSPFLEKSSLARNLENKIIPALKLSSHIIEIKKLEKGETVGYGNTFTASRKMKIGILPIGYYDGVDRRLGNLGFVEVKGSACQIIGKVCMNITTVDLSSVKNVYVGQNGQIIGSKGLTSLPNISSKINTLPYQLLANLSGTTKRILIG